MYAFESRGIEPDFVCLGKGLGNGIPVSAVVGRGDIFADLKYGDGSDTWSANAVACAAVVATLDEFETSGVLEHAQTISRIFFRGLERLKETAIVTKVRGEGMVFGIECGPFAELTRESSRQQGGRGLLPRQEGGRRDPLSRARWPAACCGSAPVDDHRGAGRSVIGLALRTGVGSFGKTAGKGGHCLSFVCH